MARYFLTCWFFFTCCLQVFGQTPSYVLIGRTVHLKPQMSGQPHEISWKHNGNKLVTFDGREEHVFGQHQHRVTMDWITAELNITDVRYEDSGEYELKAIKRDTVYDFFYRLEVLGKVSKPTITCAVTPGDSDENGTETTLTCSAEPTRSDSLVKYEWQSDGNVVTGQKLTIPLGDEHDNKIYTCRVNNPVSNEVETFTAKSCYSDEGLSVGLVVGLVIAMVLIFALILSAIVFYRMRGKGFFAKTNKGDVESQTLKHKGQDEEIAKFPDENLSLLQSTAATLPSHQRLQPSTNSTNPVGVGGGKDGSDEKTSTYSGSPLGRKPSFCEDQHNHTNNGKVDTEFRSSNSGKEQKLESSPSTWDKSPLCNQENVTSEEKSITEEVQSSQMSERASKFCQPESDEPSEPDPVRALDFSEDIEIAVTEMEKIENEEAESSESHFPEKKNVDADDEDEGNEADSDPEGQENRTSVAEAQSAENNCPAEKTSTQNSPNKEREEDEEDISTVSKNGDCGELEKTTEPESTENEELPTFTAPHSPEEPDPICVLDFSEDTETAATSTPTTEVDEIENDEAESSESHSPEKENVDSQTPGGRRQDEEMVTCPDENLSLLQYTAATLPSHQRLQPPTDGSSPVGDSEGRKPSFSEDQPNHDINAKVDSECRSPISGNKQKSANVTSEEKSLTEDIQSSQISESALNSSESHSPEKETVDAADEDKGNKSDQSEKSDLDSEGHGHENCLTKASSVEINRPDIEKTSTQSSLDEEREEEEEEEEDTGTNPKNGKENVEESEEVEKTTDPESTENKELSTVTALHSPGPTPEEQHSEASPTDKHSGDEAAPDDGESDVSGGRG